VGAPSMRRPWNGGQGDIRAHPPVEPARGQCTHRVSVDRSDCRAAGERGGGHRLGGPAWLEDRAIAEERIEDPGQAASERDDGDLLAAAGSDAERPGAERLGLGRPAAEDGDGGLNQEPARAAGLW
jgi:hypothetical protein